MHISNISSSVGDPVQFRHPCQPFDPEVDVDVILVVFPIVRQELAVYYDSLFY